MSHTTKTEIVVEMKLGNTENKDNAEEGKRRRIREEPFQHLLPTYTGPPAHY